MISAERMRVGRRMRTTEPLRQRAVEGRSAGPGPGKARTTRSRESSGHSSVPAPNPCQSRSADRERAFGVVLFVTARRIDRRTLRHRHQQRAGDGLLVTSRSVPGRAGGGHREE